MKFFFAFAFAGLLISGCATPKIGEDILIEPQGNIRFENSRAEIMVGLLTLLGVGDKHESIRLGSDLKVINKWHSDLKLISLTYSFDDEKVSIAKGEAVISQNDPIVVASGKEKIIPLLFAIDSKRLDEKRIVGIFQSKRKLILRGDIVIEVWGIQKHYPFEKEATKLVQKAFMGGA